MNFLVDFIKKIAYYISMMKRVVKKSAAAKALADRKYHQRIVLSKKGRGSYNRKKLENVYA